jgi:hypothetical protein
MERTIAAHTAHTIPAKVYSDDFAKYADFDAVPWFESASPERLMEFARNGWCGSDLVEIARCRGLQNDAVADVFAYAMFLRHGGLGCVTTCRVDAVAALEWLAFHRPTVLAALRKAA